MSGVPVPAEPVLIIALVAATANLVVMTAILLPFLFGRGRSLPSLGSSIDPHGDAGEAGILGLVEATPDGVSAQAYDRVVRIASWSFLFVVATIVGVTGLWSGMQSAILVLLALAGLFVLIVHDLLPSDALGAGKYVLEGSVAITFATLLVALTGGVDSPFFFTFPLIVGGAALVVSPRVTVVLAVVAAIGYMLAVVSTAPAWPIAPRTVATVGVNLTALILLAYVGMVIGREQRRSRDAAIRLSTIDPLTGLFNRTYFFAALEREIARCARSGRGFCLLMMDLDELKAINDRHGHFHGDRALRGVGEVVRQGVRRIDTAARYGGDEFVVLLPETDPTGAFVVAEKMRLGVAEMPLALPGSDLRPSLSIGVVAFPDDGASADELMIAADAAMYESKRAGKNRVTGVLAPRPIVADGPSPARGVASRM